MSYCRFSSDDFQCDVYVYEDVSGGWTTHVAGNRIVWDQNFLDLMPTDVMDRYIAVGNTIAIFEGMRTNNLSDPLFDEFKAKHGQDAAPYKRENVDHPDAQQSFNDPTAAACADRLQRYKDEGLHVPQEAIDELRAEAAAT